MADAPKLGLALSGGGHRAACWAAGAVLGLIDADAGKNVVSVASVSGGSIANGVIAVGGDLRSADRRDAEAWLAPGLHQWAHDGLFFPGPSTDSWVAATLGFAALAISAVVAAVGATVGASRSWDPTTILWLSVGLLAAGSLAVALAWRVLPATPIRGAVLAGAVAVGPLSFLAASAASDSSWWLLVIWPVAAVLLWAAVRRFGRRSEAAVTGLEQTVFSSPRRLAELSDRPVHHVFCATNLRTGNNTYLSNRLAWGYPEFAASPGSVSVAAAVQASACLPGAFLARTVDLVPGDPASAVVLSDGGVYDNMADQWEWGYPNRVRYAAENSAEAAALLRTAQAAAATHLVVVNASRGMAGTSEMATPPGFRGELASALGAKDVLYDVSTATRRRLLIEMFDRARTNPDQGPGGMLIHIGSSPYQVVDRFLEDDGPIATRADDAAAVLDQLTDAETGAGANADPKSRRRYWSNIANDNSTVKTTLAPLERIDPGSTTRLLHHAWVLTRVTCYVLHGWGSLPTAGVDDWRSDRFAALVAAGRLRS
jgi:predicted acylesterase/phospholipase RssA